MPRLRQMGGNLKKEVSVMCDFSNAIEAYKTIFTDYPDVISTEQAAEMLGHIGRKKVYELIKNGSIRTLPCGKGYKIAKRIWI